MERTPSQMYYEDGLKPREILNKLGYPADKFFYIHVKDPKTGERKRLVSDEKIALDKGGKWMPYDKFKKKYARINARKKANEEALKKEAEEKKAAEKKKEEPKKPAANPKKGKVLVKEHIRDVDPSPKVKKKSISDYFRRKPKKKTKK